MTTQTNRQNSLANTVIIELAALAAVEAMLDDKPDNWAIEANASTLNEIAYEYGYNGSRNALSGLSASCTRHSRPEGFS